MSQILLRKRYSQKKAVEIATILSDGRWTHDFPILVTYAKQLGLPVSTDMPRTVYDLMDLYPQGAKDRPSVLYVPVRRGVGGADSPPRLPDLIP